MNPIQADSPAGPAPAPRRTPATTSGLLRRPARALILLATLACAGATPICGAGVLRAAGPGEGQKWCCCGGCCAYSTDCGVIPGCKAC